MSTNLINMAENITKSLKKSMLGGINKESAEKAIKEIAEEGNRQVNELSHTVSSQSARITKLNDEILTFQQRLNTANAALNYSRTELATKNNALAETTEQLMKSQADLTKANEVKKGETVLEDGSIQEIKINKNGTRMLKIKAANGNLKSVEVEQLDGTKRHTDYDIISGKRVGTKTNATGEEVNIDYDISGKTANISTKAEPKPEVIKRTKEGAKIVEEFSDGSRVIKSQCGVGKCQIEKFDKFGNQTEIYQEHVKDNTTVSLHIVSKNNQEIITATTKNANFERTQIKTLSTNEFGEKFVSEYKIITPKGKFVYRPTKTDIMGNITKGEAVATYKLPANADGFRVKTVKTEYDIINTKMDSYPKVIRDTVIAQNGSRLERTYHDNRISQTLAYDEKGTGNCYITNQFRFSETGFVDPFAAGYLDVSKYTRELF